MATLALPHGVDRKTETRVQEMASVVHGHEALNNEFYDRWVGSPLSYPQVRVFAAQYLKRTVNTSVMIALSVLHDGAPLALPDGDRDCHGGHSGPSRPRNVSRANWRTTAPASPRGTGSARLTAGSGPARSQRSSRCADGAAPPR